jgi:predicted porin
MTGLGVNYNFSKTTRAYMRYDNLNYNTAAQASGSEVKRTAIGFSTSF